MSISWLKQSVLNSGAPKVGVIDILRKNMGGYQKARSHKVVHASDVTKPNFCPRYLALLDLTGSNKKDEYISTALQATFDMGHATATLVVEKWMGQNAIGNWKCRKCGQQRTMCSKPQATCQLHGECNWEFIEPNFVSTEYGISGSLDVLADVGSKWLVVELKIMKAEDWEALVTPLPEHRIRTNLYLKLIADSDSMWKNNINLHEARVLYVSRGYGKKNLGTQEILPFKEYTVQRDDAGLQPMLNQAKKIKIFRDYMAQDDGCMDLAPIPDGICKTALDKYAKNCNMCKECFSGKYPAKT